MNKIRNLKVQNKHSICPVLYSIPLYSLFCCADTHFSIEIFAGAMQDYDKAQIIGTQTFGKGIVQTIRPLTDGSAVKYTIAKYFTPKGQDIHGKGVTPDSIVELPDDATEDVQLKAADLNCSVVTSSNCEI